MKKLNLMLPMIMLCTIANAQNDSAKTTKPDTIKVGNIIIIKKSKGDHRFDMDSQKEKFDKKHKSRISTNWLVVDLGIANYSDKTNYATANAEPFLQSGGTPFSKGDFNLRDGKSINVNIWFFIQQLDLIKKNVGLKYGLGIELNNYRFKKGSLISFREGGVPYTGLPALNDPFIFRDSISGFSKNKLALDYLTIPVMLNFQTTPRHHKKTLNLAFGVSMGYLYSQRNKQVSDERGKQKNRGDYDFEKFKFSYVAELGMGPIKLYGSYSPKSMYQHTMDVRPYTLGIRFSN